MATLSSRGFSAARTVLHRLAVQAALSGTVMIALNAVSHIDLGLENHPWPELADERLAGEPEREALVLPALPGERRIGAAAESELPKIDAEPASEDGANPKSPRLPIPARLFAVHRPIAEPMPTRSTRFASREADPVSGVLLFDQCEPVCESHDPLLRRVALADPTPRTAPGVPPAGAAMEVPAGPISTEVVPSSIGEDEFGRGFLSRTWQTGVQVARDRTQAAVTGVSRMVSW